MEKICQVERPGNSSKTEKSERYYNPNLLFSYGHWYTWNLLYYLGIPAGQSYVLDLTEIKIFWSQLLKVNKHGFQQGKILLNMLQN